MVKLNFFLTALCRLIVITIASIVITIIVAMQTMIMITTTPAMMLSVLRVTGVKTVGVCCGDIIDIVGVCCGDGIIVDIICVCCGDIADNEAEGIKKDMLPVQE